MTSTVAGNGQYGYSGDGAAATTLSLAYPQGIAVSTSNDLFIADTNNYRIRKVLVKWLHIEYFHFLFVVQVNSVGVMSTYAGTGSSSFGGDGGPATSAYLNYPVAVALDSMGVLYINDYNNNVIRMVR